MDWVVFGQCMFDPEAREAGGPDLLRELVSQPQAPERHPHLLLVVVRVPGADPGFRRSTGPIVEAEGQGHTLGSAHTTVVVDLPGMSRRLRVHRLAARRTPLLCHRSISTRS